MTLDVTFMRVTNPAQKAAGVEMAGWCGEFEIGVLDILIFWAPWWLPRKKGPDSGVPRGPRRGGVIRFLPPPFLGKKVEDG